MYDMVNVESTKLNQMTDFIEIETGHSMMRYKKDVAQQTIFFLKMVNSILQIMLLVLINKLPITAF